MPRISREREAAVRRRILEAGIAVFQAQGYQRASMSAIAAGAGLSNGGLYTHFESKEELFLAAFSSLVADEEAQLVAAITADRPTAERISIALDYFLAVAAADPRRDVRGAGPGFLVHAWATADERLALREALLHRRAQMRALALGIIEDGVARGEIPATVDVLGLAGAISALLDGLLLQRAELGEAFRAEDARRQADAVVDAILSRA